MPLFPRILLSLATCSALLLVSDIAATSRPSSGSSPLADLQQLSPNPLPPFDSSDLTLDLTPVSYKLTPNTSPSPLFIPTALSLKDVSLDSTLSFSALDALIPSRFTDMLAENSSLHFPHALSPYDEILNHPSVQTPEPASLARLIPALLPLLKRRKK